MTEENKKEEKIELKLKFSPSGKKTKPREEQTDSAPATAPLPELTEVKVNIPEVPRNAASPERTKDGKPAEKVDMSSKTVPHLPPAKKTEAEKNFRRHVFKCWFWLVIAPVLLVLLASLLATAYLFYLIMVNPNHAKTVRTSLATIRTQGVDKELLKKMFVPKKKKKAEEDKYEHVIYDSRIHDDTSVPAPPSRPVRGSSGYGGGGRNNPYNLSRQRERINKINSQHNDKFKQHEDGERRKKK